MDSEDEIKRYDILMHQNRFEHTSYWSRFGFMLLSQVALFGFFLNVSRRGQGDATTDVLLRGLPLCFLGLVMVGAFYFLSHITGWWIDRWLELIKKQERLAFGEIEVVRNALPPGSVRTVAKVLTTIVGFLWAIAAAVLIARQ